MSVDSSSSNDSILNFDTSLLPSPFAATQPAPEAVIYRPPAPTAPPAPPPHGGRTRRVGHCVTPVASISGFMEHPDQQSGAGMELS